MVNGYFRYIDYGGSLEYYIFEIANYSFLVLLLCLCYKLRFININSLIVWTGIFFVPLVLNYFIFSPSLFPDQFQYALEVMSLKSKGISIDAIASQNAQFSLNLGYLGSISIPTNPVTFSTTFLGFAPIPNFMTVTSLAFANKFFLFVSFLGLKKFFFKDENILLLFFLIPSLLLYTSLALRETLIIICSVFFLLNMLKNNYIISLIFLLPLFVLKIQMFAFLALYFVGRLVFRANNSLYMLVFFLGFILLASILLQDVILQIINYYRLGFAAENMDLGDGIYGYYAFSLYGEELAESLELTSILEVVFASIAGLPKLLLMPYPNTWSNIFYPIQFFESIFLILLYWFISVRNNLLKNKEFIYLSVILLLSCMLYSLLVFNVGTFVRYRFSLFFPFIIALYYLATLERGNKTKLLK